MHGTRRCFEKAQRWGEPEADRARLSRGLRGFTVASPREGPARAGPGRERSRGTDAPWTATDPFRTIRPHTRTAVTAAEVNAAVRADWSIAIRAGSKPHRFIRIWAVVVRGRVFVRSWMLTPRSWYRTLLEEPSGIARVAREELPFRAARVR